MSMDDVSEKALREMAKIKPEQWKKLTETLVVLKSLIDVDPSGSLQSMVDYTLESAKLKFEEITAPLKNELDALLYELLEPFVPMMQEAVEWLVPIIQQIANWIIEIRTFLTTPGDIAPPGILLYADWLKKFPGGSLQDYMRYLHNKRTIKRDHTYTKIYKLAFG